MTDKLVNELQVKVSNLEKLVTNLATRSDMTLMLFSAMIADGMIKREGFTTLIQGLTTDEKVLIPIMEEEKKHIINMLDKVKNAG